MVADLADLDLAVVAAPRGICAPVCVGGVVADVWQLRFDGFDPALQGRREVLCAIGNGYSGTRAALPEARADRVHYPGTYLAGVYNRLTSVIGERDAEHEHLVNTPDWMALTFRTPDGVWFDVVEADVLEHTVTLDLRRALWQRQLRWGDTSGRITAVRQQAYVSMAHRHLAVLECEFTAENWDGPLTVHSLLDGEVANTNVVDDAALVHRHLTTVAARVDGDGAALETETTTSHVRIAQAARVSVTGAAAAISPIQDGQCVELSMVPGAPVTLVKIVATVTSRDVAAASPAATAADLLAQAGDAEAIRRGHERAWARLWDRFDTEVDADEATRLSVRLHTYQLLSSVSEHLDDVDAGMGARGLTGEGYRGHVFWDELFVLPVLNLRRPRLAHALLRYRYRRLDAARAAARATGLSGAMFPWQSGSDGRDETPDSLYNPLTGQWMPDNSRRQRHVGIAVAYNAWQHYQVTGHLDFLTEAGGELVIEVARFLASLARYDTADDRYHIDGVMGPDEFHDGYPDMPGQGLRDNAYTNVMTAWVLDKALRTVRLLAGHHCGEIWDRLDLHEHELDRWDAVSRRLAVPFHADGVISQFDGYEHLDEFDWDRYRAR
ncbi:MAG: family 65 glycosyl hydrolase, partial [Micromonosporaceae bacterium]